MKKLTLIALAAFVFASCGGGNDMEADAKTLCDCFAKGGDTQPCIAKFEEMKKNYSKEESKKLWEKATLGCN
ncbi:MAG TPA: hypothetical protein VK177_15370 [Flavobacteriales bacterium]|nr:hypothetical protein [Flavobacteriales bacterium]